MTQIVTPTEPAATEALVDALSLVYALAEDLSDPLFQECIDAAEKTLLHLHDHPDQSPTALTEHLASLRQRVLEAEPRAEDLQSYSLDLLLSVGMGALLGSRWE